MTVTFAEIDAFVDKLMNEAPGDDYTQRLGIKNWYLRHALSENYGCATCRPGAVMIDRGSHDLVNINLGKEVHDAANLERLVTFVIQSYAKWHKTDAELVHATVQDLIHS